MCWLVSVIWDGKLVVKMHIINKSQTIKLQSYLRSCGRTIFIRFCLFRLRNNCRRIRTLPIRITEHGQRLEQIQRIVNAGYEILFVFSIHSIGPRTLLTFLVVCDRCGQDFDATGDSIEKMLSAYLKKSMSVSTCLRNIVAIGLTERTQFRSDSSRIARFSQPRQSAIWLQQSKVSSSSFSSLSTFASSL